MTTKKEKLFINIVLALFVAGIICCFTLFPLLCDTVSAEELTSNSVLDFNQLFNNTISRSNYNTITITKSNFTYSIKGYFTDWSLNLALNETVPSINLISGHKYYLDLNLNVLSGPIPQLRLFSGDSVYYNIVNDVQIFILNNSVTCSLGLFVNSSLNSSSNPYNFSCSPMLVDLTQCFGSGNEPSTVEEFRSFFANDTYAYTTSTLISLDTLQSYNNGVADTLNSYKYVVTANDSYNNLIPYGNDTVMTRGIDSNGKYYNEFSNAVDDNKPKYAYFGFSGGTLPSGSKLTLTGYCLQGQTSPEGVDVAVLVGSNFVNVGHLFASRESWKYNTLSFTLPYASSGIYFIGLGYSSFKLNDFVIEIETTDFDTLYGLAYKRGQDSRDSDVTIAFENGKKVGMSQSNPYTFNALFGAVFDAPIQALTGLLDFDILGVNMKGLYLSLFTLALIIFVVKLCLGKV